MSLMLAGCTASGGIMNSWKDAEQRFCTAIGGSDLTTQAIDVPAGTSSLRVAANWNVGGQASFTLKDPTGLTKKSASPTGGATLNDDSWYSTSNPMAGAWKLTLQANGGVTYCFGVYL